jgi:hypothetical protein
MRSGGRAARRRLDLLPAEGEREIFLCHTLCELGAERLESTLKAIRGWLERNPSETLVLLLESSVDPPRSRTPFDDATSCPTWRRCLATGRCRRCASCHQRPPARGARRARRRRRALAPARVPVPAEHVDRGLHRVAGACDPGRGTPDSPLLVVNHWVDRFPPPLTSAAEVNLRAALLERTRSCQERFGRMPNAIAVDFYDRGDLIATGEELNRGG